MNLKKTKEKISRHPKITTATAATVKSLKKLPKRSTVIMPKTVSAGRRTTYGGARDGSECSSRNAGHTDHPGAFQVDQRHAANLCNALDRICVGRCRADAAARVRDVVTVADDTGDLFVDRRPERLRVDNFRPEVRQFHGLVVGQLVDDLRFGDPVRVSAHHPVDVRPDAPLRGV